MNPWLVVSCLLDVVVALGLRLDPGLSDALPWLGGVLLGFVGLQAIGVGLVLVGRVRAGAIVAMVGACAFVPIGLVGVWGARKALDGVSDADFQRRREAAARTS